MSNKKVRILFFSKNKNSYVGEIGPILSKDKKLEKKFTILSSDIFTFSEQGINEYSPIKDIQKKIQEYISKIEIKNTDNFLFLIEDKIEDNYKKIIIKELGKISENVVTTIFFYCMINPPKLYAYIREEAKEFIKLLNKYEKLYFFRFPIPFKANDIENLLHYSKTILLTCEKRTRKKWSLGGKL